MNTDIIFNFLLFTIYLLFIIMSFHYIENLGSKNCISFVRQKNRLIKELNKSPETFKT